MNNFGVVEIATAKTTSAPGWAYVPDTRDLPGAARALPANRKRARPGVSGEQLSARHEAKVHRDLQALDRDVAKENSIPVRSRAQGKHTPGVRRILQSQKTFANHLDDYAAAQQQTPAADAAAGAINGSGKRPARRDRAREPEEAAAAAAAAGPAPSPSLPAKLVVPLEAAPRPAAHPGDASALLASRVPGMPGDEEVRGLLAQAPLGFYEAGARWGEEEEEAGARPGRVFCEVCGYWGRVRCGKCGTRVCALECLETHREECVARYGL